MSLSSFCVCMNALRLNLVKLYDKSRDRKGKPADFSALLAKYEQLYAAGFRRFGLLLDDIGDVKFYTDDMMLADVINRLNASQGIETHFKDIL